MSEERFLVDKSALTRRDKPIGAPVLDDLTERGLLCVSAAVEMEIVDSVRRVAVEGDDLAALVARLEHVVFPDTKPS